MKLRVVIVALIALASASTLLGDDDDIGALAIVAGKKTTITGLSMDQLVAIFKCERKSKPAFVMRETGSPERALVLKCVYQMTENEYRRLFLQATFTGAVTSAPKQVSSPQSVKKYVNDNDGALGYMRLSDVDDSVKVIRIDGKSPGDGQYPIKSRN